MSVVILVRTVSDRVPNHYFSQLCFRYSAFMNSLDDGPDL